MNNGPKMLGCLACSSVCRSETFICVNHLITSSSMNSYLSLIFVFTIVSLSIPSGASLAEKAPNALSLVARIIAATSLCVWSTSFPFDCTFMTSLKNDLTAVQLVIDRATFFIYPLTSYISSTHQRLLLHACVFPSFFSGFSCLRIGLPVLRAGPLFFFERGSGLA